MQQSKYMIYNASAGAGKTYLLVKKILIILLQNNTQDSIRSILAITFTNKAANEMKTRILSWLKDFSDEKKYSENKVLQQISNELGIEITILHERAKSVLTYILHHYSLLSVSTIDKFNLRLMKSFTKELGLSYSFSVELDASDYLKQSIDELMNELGTDNPVTEVILDYIFWKFENESATDIRKDLLSSSQNFLKEMHLEKIEAISQKDFEDFKKLNHILLDRIKVNHKKITHWAEQAITLIESNSLTTADFYQGARGIGGFFYKLLNEEEKKNNYSTINLQSVYYKDFCENEKYTKPKSDKELEVKEIAPKLIKTFFDVKESITRIQVDESVRKNLLTIELQSEINRFLTDKKNNRDILFLSDVNPIISKHLREEPVAFIYEKLGGRYNHYFIDEFQDTSQLQWDNLLPLINNTKVSNGTSITLVGDPKQSIYRFRSGKPEILMELIDTAKEKEVEVVILENNYRSLPNIVNFNNKYYQFIADTVLHDPLYKELFGKQAQQKSIEGEGGRVQMSFVAEADEDNNYLALRVLEIIREVEQQGFSFKDIALLVRNKKQAYPIIELLVEHNYPVLTEEALQISTSPVIQTVIYALQWINATTEYENLLLMLYNLQKLNKITIEDFTAEALKIKDLSVTQIIEYLEDTYSIRININFNSNISFFDYVENLIRALGFGEGEEIYISRLLDFILQLEKVNVISILEFLENWNLKNHNISISFPNTINAIQIMTIHKSKGLEFPVVIYPIIETRKPVNEYWFPLESELYNGFEQYYTPSKSGVEKTSDTFKEIIEKKEFERLIDELCIQYVATTRASQQLFLIEEQKENSKEKSILQNFLLYNSVEPTAVVDLYTDLSFTRKESDDDHLYLEDKIEWSSESWIKKIRVSTEAGKFYSEENENIQYGNIIHSILAELTRENGALGNVIERKIMGGWIDSSQKDKIQKTIESIVQAPELRKYFSLEVKSYIEREILFEDQFYRPDRVVEIEGIYTIIDFKTGGRQANHIKQITKYAEVLQSLGKLVANKKLVYIQGDTVEIVTV